MRPDDANPKAIAHGDDRRLELLVPQEPLVEGAQRVGVLVVHTGGDPTAPEHVIDGDHAAGRHLWQQRVEVRDVLGLDGVDEGELDAGSQPWQHPQRRLIDDADAVGYPGAQPVAAGWPPRRTPPGGCGDPARRTRTARHSTPS